MSHLRIGTCSWKYPSWTGLLYSAEGTDYLAEYCLRYNTVEVDQWFWSLFGPGAPRLPRQADVQQYRACVPQDFRFTVKVPNSITLTHYRGKSKADPLVPNPHFLSVELLAQFLATLEPIRDVLGPLIFQFGYLNRQKMSGQAEFQQRFGEFVAQLPPDLDYALETRNPNFLNEALFGFMASNRLIPVLLQGYWMPSVVDVYRKQRTLLLRQRAVVVRLHGPDREAMEKETGQKWDKLVVRRDAELGEIVAIVKDLLAEGVDVYLNVNNHYEGCAPLTIARVEERLGS